jgi:hypothetical protein
LAVTKRGEIVRLVACALLLMAPALMACAHDGGSASGKKAARSEQAVGRYRRAEQGLSDDGKATLVARRESLDDVVRAECDERLA